MHSFSSETPAGKTSGETNLRLSATFGGGLLWGIKSKKCGLGWSDYMHNLLHWVNWNNTRLIRAAFVVCSYNQSVRCLFLLSSRLWRRRWRRCRLSRLSRCFCRGSGRAGRRRIHKDFVCHTETDLLPLVHVEVMGPLVCLIFPKPNLLCFVTDAAAKDDWTVQELRWWWINCQCVNGLLHIFKNEAFAVFLVCDWFLSKESRTIYIVRKSTCIVLNTFS